MAENLLSDSDVWGSPAQSVPSGLLSDDDVWGTPKPKEQRGAIAEIGRQIVGGLVTRAPAMIGGALEWWAPQGSALEDAGRVAKEYWTEKEKAWEPDLEGRGFVSSTLIKGASQLGPSLAGMGAAMINPVLGGAAVATIFGGQQAQDTYDKGLKAGLSEVDASEAAYKTGLIEGFGETVADVAGAKLLTGGGKLLSGLIGKQGMSGAIRAATDPRMAAQFARDWAANAVIQSGTEFGQGYGQAVVERDAGISTGDPLEQGAEGAQSALGMSVLLGPLAAVGHRSAAKQRAMIGDALNDPAAPLPIRMAAGEYVAKDIEPAVGKEAAQSWLQSFHDAAVQDRDAQQQPAAAAPDVAQPSGPAGLLGHQAGPPLVVFPDGSTMTGAEAEQRRLDAMVQRAQPADILTAPDVDTAIAAAVDSVAVAEEEFADLLKSEQSDLAYLRRDATAEAAKAADFARAKEQQTDIQIDQANALTRVSGFDDQTPTAMQLALQRAQQQKTAAPAQTPASAIPIEAQPEPAAAAPNVTAQPAPVASSLWLDETPVAVAPNVDSYLKQNAAGKWQLSRPVELSVKDAVIAEMDRRNQEGSTNAATPAQAIESTPALQVLPQAAPEAGALQGELTQLPAVREQLSVEFDGQRYPVESLQDASEKWEQFRDQSEAGVSEIGNGVPIFDQTGKQVAYVSYNGNVWAGTGEVFDRNAEPIYPPKKSQNPEASRPNPVAESQAPAPSEPGDGGVAPTQDKAAPAITRTKAGKLEISGFSREDVAGSLKTAGIKATVAVGKDGRVLVTAVGRTGNAMPMPVKQQNAIKKALLGAEAKQPKPRAYTGNLRNDVNLIAPGLYAEVARGGDGEAMGIDMSLVAESLRGEGFILPTAGKDSDAVIELIRQDIANGGGTLNERRQTEAMDKESEKAARTEMLRLADEYGIETRVGITWRAADAVLSEIEAAITKEIGILGRDVAAITKDGVAAGAFTAEDAKQLAVDIASGYRGDQKRDARVTMYREIAEQLQERINEHESAASREIGGRSGEGAGTAAEAEARPAFGLEAQDAASLAAKVARENDEKAADRERIKRESEAVPFSLTPQEKPQSVREAENKAKQQSLVGERRSNTAMREKFAAMTPDEKSRALEDLHQKAYQSTLTGLQNLNAFNEHVKANPGESVLYADVDDLKNLNTRYGHNGADGILSAIGAVKAQIAEDMGVNAFHRSGDEFLATHESAAILNEYGQAVQDRLKNLTVQVTTPSGEVVEHTGVGLSFGVGKNDKLAESAANEQKAERKRLGLRTGARDATEGNAERISAAPAAGIESDLGGVQGQQPAVAEPKTIADASLGDLLRAAADKMDEAAKTKEATQEVGAGETAAQGKETAASLPSEKGKERNTEDSGAELTYNKRNRLNRGLQWEDIENKDAALRVTETVKAKVYPKPDYQSLIDSGMQPVVAHMVKQAYDAIAIKPQTRSAPTDTDLKLYIDGVNRYMAGVMSWADNPEQVRSWLTKIGKRAGALSGAMRGESTALSALAGESEKGLMETVYPNGFKEYRPELVIIGGNKALRALQPSTDEAVKALKDIDKGWPGKQEAWQKQGYQIFSGDAVTSDTYEATFKDRPPYVNAFIRITDKSRAREIDWKRFDGATSKDDPAVQAYIAERLAEVAGKQLLLDKRNNPVGIFDTVEAAQEKARELTKRQGKDSNVSDKGISVEHAERVGPDRRMEGEDISSDKLRDTFGFKGVNFGNWMKGDANTKERQLHLNHAYDAFLDLAEILNVPPKAMSLNGMLGLAIGAQGTGQYAAHFVPGVNEINLTRTSGAGSLAHEWGHALDHYFARLGGLERETDPFLTEHSSLGPTMTRMETVDGKMRGVEKPRFADTLRPEILAKFKAIVTAMNKRSMTPDELKAQKDSGITVSRKNVESWLKAIRRDFESGAVKPGTSDAASARTSAITEFDKLAERVRNMDLGDGTVAVSSSTALSPVVIEMRDAYKRAFNRAYGLDNLKGLQGNIDGLRYRLSAKDETADHVPQTTSTQYSKNAAGLDKGKGGKRYWSTDLEKFARAFDAFVSDELDAKAAKNSYLSHTERSGETVPEGEERKTINAAFKSLVAELKTKETDKGIALESRDAANIETAARRMGKFVDAFLAGQVRDQDTQIIGPTPVVLQALGAEDLSMQIDGDTVRKILDGKHGHTMTADMLRQLPKGIYDPLAVFDDPDEKTDAAGKILITELRDLRGNPVMVAVHLSKRTNRMVVNDIASAYGVENFQKRSKIAPENLDYVRNEEALGTSTTSDLLFLADVVQKARELGVIIQTEADVVNRYGDQYSRALGASITNETPATIRAGLSRSLGKAAVDRLEQSGLLRILDTADSLPDGLTISDTGTALYDGKTAYLIADRMKPAVAIREVLHEIGEHHGLEGMLGEQGYKTLTNRVRFMEKAGDKRVRQAFAFVREAYPELREDSPVFMKEILANIGQDADVRAKPWWQEMIAVVRRFLVKLGYGGMIRTGDIEDMVLHSLKVAASENRTEQAGEMTEAMASKSDQSARGPTWDEPIHIKRYLPTSGDTPNADRWKVGAGKTALKAVDTESKESNPSILESRIIGDSGRQYTPDQEAMFKQTGREVDQVTILGKLREWASVNWRQGLFDQFQPVRAISDKGYTLLRLSKGATGAFEAFMQHGKLSLKDGAYDADTTGGVMQEVFFPLGKETTDFLYWIAGNRAERLAMEGKERLFSVHDIAAAKSLAAGTTDFDYVLANGQSTRDRTLIYRDSLAKFNAFNKNVMDMAEQSGLIDAASRHLWEHEFYVPFYRLVDDTDGGVRGMNIKQGVVRQQAFKKLKGGKEGLNDLLANTLMNWAHLIDASAKNRGAMETLKAAARLGAAQPAQAGDKNTVWYMDGGKKAEYTIDDPELLVALNALDYSGLRGPIMDALQKPKHWLTIGVTASPFFKVRNLIRDSVQAVATSGLSYNIAGNVMNGIALTNRDRQEYVSALAGGGLIRFGTMLEGNEAARTRQLIKKGAKDEHILNNEGKIRAFYDKYLEPGIAAYNEIGNRGEEINRMSLYDQMIKSGADHATASLMARDLLDFSMQGSWTSIRFLAQVVPFFNARLEGIYKLGRAAKGDPAKFGAVLGAVAMFSLALLAAYSDDDDWKKREDWDRDNYWWFKVGGVAFRIPKPFEIGAIATLAERSAELMFDKEMTGKRFRQVTTKLIADQLSMNPTPQLVKPILDIYANKDSFSGRPIETMGMERLDKERRFTSSTSMPARGLSAATGGALSPVQIDHLVRGYFAWLGAFAVGTADLAVRMASDGPDRPSRDYWKFATGGMIAETDSASSRYVSQMYDQAKEIETAYGTWRDMSKQASQMQGAAKQEALKDAQEYRKANADKIAKHSQVGATKRKISALNERIRVIERSDKTANEKRALINNIQKLKDQAARRVVATRRD